MSSHQITYPRLVWHEYIETVPVVVDPLHVELWQALLDSIPSSPKSFTPAKKELNFADNWSTHQSTSPKTRGMCFRNIDTLPDYIPAGCPGIVYVAWLNSYGAGNHKYLDRCITEKKNRSLIAANQSQSAINRVRCIWRAMNSFHVSTQQLPRPQDFSSKVKRGGPDGKRKGDARFKNTLWHIVKTNQRFRTAVSKTRLQTAHGVLQHWALPCTDDTIADDPSSISDSVSEEAQVPKPGMKTMMDGQGDSARTKHPATSKRPLADGDTEPASRKRVAIRASAESSGSGSMYVLSSSELSDESISASGGDEHHEQGSVGDENSHPGTLNHQTDDSDTLHVGNKDSGTGAAGESQQAGTADFSQHSNSPRSAPYEEAAKQSLGLLAKLLLQRIRRLTMGHDPLADMSDREATNEILKTLASLNKYVIMSLIRNSLARDKVVDMRIRRITDDLYVRSADRPACYLASLVDNEGHPPTPNVIFEGIELVRLYCSRDLDANQSQMVMDMDCAIGGYQTPWTVDDLRRNFLRSYLNRPPPRPGHWGTPCATRLTTTLTFCDRLTSEVQAFCAEDASAAEQPIDFSLTYAGITMHCSRRFSEHDNNRGHDHGSYVLGMLSSALEVKYPGRYRLDSSVIMLPWYSGQSRVAEAVIARLTESYVWQGSGFNIAAAGGSNISGEANISDETWKGFFKEAFKESIRRQYHPAWSPYST